MSNTIEKSIEINGPRSKVWGALIDHEKFGAWFGAQIDAPFKVGETSTGKITVCEGAKWNSTIKAMEEPIYFAYTWHPFAIDPSVDYSSEPETLVEFWLEEKNGVTLLKVRETGFDNLPAHRITDALQANNKGWAFQLENIKKYAEN